MFVCVSDSIIKSIYMYEEGKRVSYSVLPCANTLERLYLLLIVHVDPNSLLYYMYMYCAQ